MQFFLLSTLFIYFARTCVRSCEPCDEWYEGDLITSIKYPLMNCEQTVQIGASQKFEIGIWFRYQPFQKFGEIDERNFESFIDQYKKQTQQGGSFIYSLTSKLTGDKYLVLSQVQIKNEMKFINQIFYNFRNQKQTVQFSFPSENFEGTWSLFHLSVDFVLEKTTLAFYNSQEIQPIQSQVIDNFPILPEQIVHKCGGLYYYSNENEEIVKLKSFEGKISYIFIDFNIDEQIGVDSCRFNEDYIKDSCYNYYYTLSDFNQQLDGTQFYYFNISEITDIQYSIQGWVKFDQNLQEQKIINLIRVTINLNYNNDHQIGDKDFFLQYFQSQNFIENGFELSTYSYVYPIKQRYITPDELKITVKGEIYHNLISKWHFIQYIYGLQDENYQPLYQVYFPELNEVQQYRWPININHFHQQDYYIYVGGDLYSTNFFNGQFSNIEVRFFCPEDNDFSIKCHYSCQQCFGPTETDCIICPENSFRYYSLVTRTCTCQMSYVNIENNAICQKANTALAQMQINEIELKCDKQGYDVCNDEEIRCSFGYFQFQKHCVQCPFYEIYSKGSSILCLDCYAYPEIFSLSFTCTVEALTFSLEPDNTFQIIKKSDQDIEFYSEYYLQKNQNFYLQLMNGFKKQNECKEGYFQSNNQCLKCIEGCVICNDQVSCQTCIKYYGYLPQKGICKKCSIDCFECQFSDDYKIETCKVDAQNFFGYEYIPKHPICGEYCLDCDDKGYCNQCQQDQQNYFQSFDGKNCSPCNIQNCKYCMSYIKKQNEFITTIDINFSLYIDIIYDIQVICALCEPNYFYNQQIKECQLKTIVNDCEFAIIDNTNIIQCIIGTESENAIQVNDCLELTNCKQCIKQYFDQQSFCILCMNGYYSEIKSGQCQKCPMNCLTCVEQNKIYQDSWKWEIRGLYKYLINQNNDHSFEQFALTQKEDQYEIICLSCYENYVLNNKQCIKNCDQGCQNCQIINNKSVCIKCYDNGLIKIKSQDDQGNCKICPLNCVACLDRTAEEINQINPYFVSTSINLYQTKLCIEKQQNIQDNEHYYYDQNLKLIRTCFNSEKCEHKAIITSIVHCNFGTYSEEKNKSKDPLFLKKNIYVSYLFSGPHFDLIDSQQIWAILEQMAVTTVQYELYFKEGLGKPCNFQDMTENLNLKVLQKVFTVKQIDVKFIGLNPYVILPIEKSFKISNFTNIIFENVVLNFKNADTGFFTLFNLQPRVTLKLLNVKITSSVKLQNQQSYFYSEQLISLIMVDVFIYNIKLINSTFIKFTSNIENQVSVVDVKNLNIQDCNITSSTIFYIKPKSSQINLKIENLTITNTKFIDSSFMISKQLSVNDIITIKTKLFKFKQIILYNNSFIFYIENAKELLYEQILFEESEFKNSQFSLSNILNLKDIEVMDITLYESNLFSNQISTLTNEKNAQFISITNCKFSKILYDSKQSLIYIVSNDENNLQVVIEDLLVTDNKLIDQQVFSEISFSHSIIQIYCNVCKFKNINIERGYGLPEMTILNSTLIDINNFRITQIQNYYPKILHSKFDCVKQFAQINFFFFIYFGDYKIITINNLSINSTISFNYPLLIFQGQNLLKKQQNETILIQNSYFGFNQLSIYKAFSLSGIISLNSEQNSMINLQNNIFTNNHLNEYYQDASIISATLFVIQQRQGLLQIFACSFFYNIITNSSNSIIYVSTDEIEIKNTKFQQNNWIDYNQLIKNVLLQKTYLIGQKSLTISQLKKIFPVKSQSGNGYLQVQNLLIDDIQVNQSFSKNAGGFYIYLKGNSSVFINQSQFFKTQASLLNSDNSQGGCLLIDAEKSSLNFKIMNTIFNTTSSRKEGGGIYMIPSLSYNFVELENITVLNSFAITSSFLSYKLTQTDQLYSQLNIINSKFQQTESGFIDFLSKLEDLSTSETLEIVYNRPLIYTMYGNIHIFNCDFFSSYLTYLANIDQANQIIIEELIIQNSTVFQSSFLKLSLGLYQTGQIIIKNFQMLNTQVLQRQQNLTCDNTRQNYQSSSLDCPNQDTSNILDKISLSTSDDQNFFNCNFNSFFSNNNQNFSLLEINNLQSFHSFKVQNLILQNNSCDQCYYGILKISNLAKQQNVRNIIINKLQISQNSCGYTGCLSIITNTSSSWIRNDLLNTRILQIQNYDKIKSNVQYQVLLQNSEFFNNYAQLGGSLFGVEIQLLILNCFFSYNQAIIGGAIYYYSSIKQLILLDSKIQYNFAKIAGGLFLNDQSLQELHKLEVIIDENNSTFTGSNVYEIPRSLTLITNQDYQILEKKQIKLDQIEIIEQIEISPYKVLGQNNKTKHLMLPSGRAIGSYEYFDKFQLKFIPYSLTLRIVALNKMNQQVKGLDGHICKISPLAINSTSQEIISNLNYALSYENITYDSISGDFNLDDLIIYFNPNYEEDLVLRLIFTCDFINYPIQEAEPPYLIKQIIQNYQLQVDIKTFDCQIGEYLNSTSGGCVLCDTFQNQYQVSENAQNCSYKEDLKMNQIKSSMIELKPHFWRAYYYSSTIEYCQHLDQNCLGGWYPGDISCIIGHIGALCEQCDLYNIKGEGSFSVSSTYSCGSCENISRNVISIVFISLWTLISIIMSVNSTVEMINEFIIGLKFNQFKIAVSIKNASTAILIKVLTNYLQIITTITTFQLQVPIGVITAFNSAGNPVENMAYSLDCFLVSISNIDIIYFRIIWSLLMETFYILTFFIIELLAVAFNIIKYNTSQITTALLYIFIFLQPNLISSLISLLSYRTLSDEKWIQGNVAYRYDTFSHLKWSLAFSLPFLLLFSCILPFLLWYGVYKNRLTLDKISTRQSWGYLYNEYKLSAYFWETVKILQKEFIIIVLSYYDDHIPIKASLIFLILFAYSYLTQENKPYTTSELNLLDSQSTIVCAVSIILASSIYSAQKSNLIEIVMPFYIIIGILNFVFVTKMIIKIFFAYFYQLYQQIDKVKTIINTKFPNIATKYPFISKLLELHSVKQARIRKRFNQLKQAIMPQVKKLIELKRNNIEFFQEKPDQSQLNSQSFENQNQVLFTNGQESDQTQKVLDFDPSSQNLQILSSPNIVKVYPEEKLIKNENK